MLQVFVWDSPNMNSTLLEIYGEYSPSNQRADMSAIMNWLVRRADENGREIAAGVFTNIRSSKPGFHKFQAWLRHLSTIGFFVGVRNKDEVNDTDIDEMMIQFIEERLSDTTEVIIASHDARRFGALIERLQLQNIDTLVIGFAELANGYGSQVMFQDLESIPGVFKEPLPRHIPTSNLPSEGKIFAPSGTPRVSEDRPARRPQRVAPRLSRATSAD